MVYMLSAWVLYRAPIPCFCIVLKTAWACWRSIGGDTHRPDLTYSVGILAPKRISDELSGLEDAQNSAEEEGAVDEAGGDENIEAPPAP